MKNRHGVLVLTLGFLLSMGGPVLASEYEVIEVSEDAIRVEDTDGLLKIKQDLRDSTGKIIGRVTGRGKGSATLTLAKGASPTIGQPLNDGLTQAQEFDSPVTRTEPRGLNGIRRILLISGATSYGTTEVKPGGSGSTTSKIGVDSAAWTMAYLRSGGQGMFFGPSLNYSITTSSTEYGSAKDKTSFNLLSPGVMFRAVSGSGRDQYVALTGVANLGVLFGSTESTSSGSTSRVSFSGSGFGYQAGLSFGQRLGVGRVYLIETTIGYSGSNLNYSLSGDTAGLSSTVGEFSSGNLTFGISIGIGL